jgi:1-pyrroline-5-carboxylate dehydrogenase
MLQLTLIPSACAAAVGGHWSDAAKHLTIPDPLNGESFLRVPDTQGAELRPFVESLLAVPKSGLHNPYKNPER